MNNCYQHEHLQLSDHHMSWYHTGQGSPLLFLHGCYDNLLYRPLLNLFADRYRCIIHDQRGSEGSPISHRSPDALHVDRFTADLESLRLHLGLERLTLIGHSWGTALALLYALHYPDHVDRLVLMGPGPLCPEATEIYRANVQRITSLQAYDFWPTVCEQYRQALQNQTPLQPQTDEAYMRIWSRVMINSPRHASQFTLDYMAAGGIARRPPNATGLETCHLLDRAAEITCPTLILHGHQDYEPVTQAWQLAQRMPAARLVLLNRCGHLAWLEQPQAILHEITCFLDCRENKP